MTKIYLSSTSLICALGHDNILQKLANADRGGMQPSKAFSSKEFILGAIREDLAAEDLRCNSILSFCYDKIKDEVEGLKRRFGAGRIGVVLGSSNGGIQENFQSLQHYLSTGKAAFSINALEINAPSDYLSKLAGLSGPSYTISTACTSGAKAFIAARRLLRANICDAVLVGGVDALCSYAVNGFDALEAMSAGYTLPFSKNRDGINMGEAGALFIMTATEPDGESVLFTGAGESSDAHHGTAPDPEGKGAYAAMQAAILDAGAINPAGFALADIGYINLHGTGTMLNDAMEGLAVHRLFGSDTPCSSTKPLVGHTLGASGAIEAAFCYLLLSAPCHSLPAHAWDGAHDSNIPELHFVKAGEKSANLQHCLSNSFAFGGSNTSLIFSKKY